MKADDVDIKLNVSTDYSGVKTYGDPPDELPRLYQLSAFVPYSEARRGRDIGLIDSAPDDWEWIRVMHKEFLPFDEVPEALINWKREFEADSYGKPHFRLVEVTGEGDPVSPVPGIALLEDESCDCPPGVCAEEEVPHHQV